METVTHGRLTCEQHAPDPGKANGADHPDTCHPASRAHEATIRRIATRTVSRTTAFDRVLGSPTHLRVLAEPTR
jgi:hypothetical protein